MKWIPSIAVLALLCAGTDAAILYEQPPNPAGGFYHSAWWDPDGSNYDEYIWDAFTLAGAADINSVEWRGAYDPAPGVGGPVVNFTVGIYGSIPAGTEPDVANPPLVEYEVGDNAGETYAGVFGGVGMYDYSFALPAPFAAQAGVRYWVQIEGWQWGYPDWSIAAGQGGDGYRFRCRHVTYAGPEGVPTGCYFTSLSGDAAFTMRTTTPIGVDRASGTAGFALAGALPNPARGDRVIVSFSLADAAPAELALFDVGGRRVAFKDVGALGPGTHVVSLAMRTPIEPGMYFARLSHGADYRIAKVIVTR